MSKLTPDQRTALINLIKIEREMLRRKAKHSLFHFMLYMWNVLEPETEYVDGWHIRVIAEHLEAVTTFDIDRLIINEPPRHMKSIEACVMWPAWVWGTRPNRSFIFGSHSLTLAQRDSIKTRQLIESPEYREVFDQQWTLNDDQNTTSKFSNSMGGVRRSVGVGSSVTGEGGDYLVVDDPHDAGEIYSELARERVKFWYDKVLSTRVNNPKKNARVIIMQRLHEDDLTGHVIKQKGDDYCRLVLPGEFNPDAEIQSRTRLNFKDPRTKPGELLWPEQWDRASLDKLKQDLGDEAEAQINQDPKPGSGGLFPRDNWKRYTASPSSILETVLFIDAAQKPGISNDYSAFAVWARTHNAFYLLDLLVEKTDAPLLESLTIKVFNDWSPNAVVIEDKSAGSSLIQYLKTQTTLPVIPFDPLQRDKVVRATAATPTVRSGKCYLPKEIKGKYDGKEVNLIKVFIKQHESFPRGKHDDIVDTTSMMTEYFNKRGTARPRIRSLN